VKVPLLIHDESRFPAGAVDDRPVTLVDLFPTLLEAAGVDRDSHPSQGLSLLSDEIPEDRAIVAEYYWPVQALGRYSEEDRSSARLDAFRRRLRSITVEDTKLVWGSDGSHELYDLSSDPEELEDLLSAADAPETEELERRLAETIARFESEVAITPASVRADDLDPDTREALRSLGYIQ